MNGSEFIAVLCGIGIMSSAAMPTAPAENENPYCQRAFGEASQVDAHSWRDTGFTVLESSFVMGKRVKPRPLGGS